MQSNITLSHYSVNDVLTKWSHSYSPGAERQSGWSKDIVRIGHLWHQTMKKQTLHAQHAALDHKRIVIQSSDTDVAGPCATHFSSLNCNELWFSTGVKNKLRYIPVWLLSWVHNYVMLCQNSMHSPAATPTVHCLELARSRPSKHYVGVTCIWAKTLHSVKILYQHVFAICIQRIRWLAAKQTKLGTGSSVRRGRGTRDYLQCQTASISI